MKTLIILAGALSLAACGVSDVHPGNVPPPPPKPPVVITKEVPVPVVCKNEVTKPLIDINSVNPDSPLEEQNRALRATIAELMVYINDLSSGFVGCGGTIK